MNPLATIVKLCSFIFLLYFTYLHSLDRIVFEDGQTNEVEILAQNKDTVTYKYKRKEIIVEKEKIKSIILDIDVDKYFKSAKQTQDREKKIRLLEKSVKNFPKDDRSKNLLIQLYLIKGQIADAQTIHKDLHYKKISFKDYQTIFTNYNDTIDHKTFRKELKSFNSSSDYTDAIKNNIHNPKEYKAYLKKNKIKKRRKAVSFRKEGFGIEVKGGIGTDSPVGSYTLITRTGDSGELGNSSSTGAQVEETIAPYKTKIGQYQLSIKANYGSVFFNYHFTHWGGDQYKLRSYNSENTNSISPVLTTEGKINRKYNTSKHELKLGLNLYKIIDFYFMLRRWNTQLRFPIQFQPDENNYFQMTSTGIGAGFEFTTPHIKRKRFSIYFPIGASLAVHPTVKLKFEGLKDSLDTPAIATWSLNVHTGIGFLLPLKVPLSIELLINFDTFQSEFDARDGEKFHSGIGIDPTTGSAFFEGFQQELIIDNLSLSLMLGMQINFKRLRKKKREN